MSKSDRQIPHDNEAEEALIGACLLNRKSMEDVVRLVTPSDFYNPSNQLIYAAMLDLWDGGSTVDAIELSNHLSKHGQLDAIGGSSRLISMQSNTPASSSATKYANIVIEKATYRNAIAIASEVINNAYEQNGNPNDIMENASLALEKALVKIGEIPADLHQLDQYLDSATDDLPDWIIPGLLKEMWRVLIVAPEGVGKTVLMRQIAMAAAQGIHPFRTTDIKPCKSLVVDLENPLDSIIDVCVPIRERLLDKSTDYDPDRTYIWHRQDGINLRNRNDRIAFETILETVNPSVVCMGPVYKMYQANGNENDERAALETMFILGKLIKRYRFGLILEHHAPKASGGSTRKMDPYGTSLWLRWPEIGLGLSPEGDGMETLTAGRFRGDRVKNEWPIKLHRSRTWPWEGEWASAPSSFADRPASTPPAYPLSPPKQQGFHPKPRDYGEPEMDDDYDWPPEPF